MPLVIPRLYAIIDRTQTGGRSPLEVADILLRSGIRLIQFRDKQASAGEFLASAARVAECVRAAEGVFIVNDRADIARAVGADGVHVGQEDLPVEAARHIVGPGKWVGCSSHTLEQMQTADLSSADYVACGPVFPTASKVNADPVVGLAGVRAARRLTRKPLVAIGGITVGNARAVLDAGADSVAVISGLISAPDIARRAEEFLKALVNLSLDL